MGYTLEAVIGSAGALEAFVRRWAVAVAVPLAQGLVLVPMTDELFDAIGAGADEMLGFWRLPAGFGRLPAGGPVAYVEAEIFGGVGSQRAALWTGGELALGPLTLEEGEEFAPEGSPISQVLARLGVRRDGQRDEFDSVGLDRHRHTEDWLS